MNDEIKEKIDFIKQILNRNELIKCRQYFNDLLDYITNLQQANKSLKENNQAMQEEIARVWEENERLKEENNNKAMNDYAHAIDESWYRELYDDYKSRCEKAIEYLDKVENLAMLDGKIIFSINIFRNILQNEDDSNE